jgi:hypothetical protein
MTIPDSGSEPLDPERSGTPGIKTRDASVSAASASASDGVSTSSTSSTRTPPPRTRRGAPATTSRPRSPESNGEGGASKSSGPKATPASSKVFNWDDDGVASASAASATAAITAAAVTPIEEPEEFATAPSPTRQPKPAKPQKARRPERRFRQTVQRIDLWSVTKMALCFYISAMAVVVVSLIALYTVADSAGIIGNVEKFIGDLFSAKDFHIVSGQVLRGAVLVSIVLVALMVVFTIIAASFYNIFAELFGGIEITIREEEQPAKR